MFVSLKANRKRIIAFLVLVLAVVAACLFLRWQGGEGEPGEPVVISGGTNEERLAYLTGFGWQVEQEPAETREVMIPREFNDVYQNYNAMQQAQGFDLAPYSGQVVTQYKYLITNYPDETEVYATLLVLGEQIIGGDVACGKVDGFMHGFAKDSARYGEATPAPSSSAPESSCAQESSAAPESTGSYVNSSDVESSAAEEGPAESTAASGESSGEPESQPEEGAEDTGAIPEEAWPTD